MHHVPMCYHITIFLLFSLRLKSIIKLFIMKILLYRSLVWIIVFFGLMWISSSISSFSFSYGTILLRYFFLLLINFLFKIDVIGFFYLLFYCDFDLIKFICSLIYRSHSSVSNVFSCDTIVISLWWRAYRRIRLVSSWEAINEVDCRIPYLSCCYLTKTVA